MNKNKIILAILLCIAAFFSLMYGIKSSGKINQRATEKLLKTDGSGETVLQTRQSKKTLYTSWGRNPFALEKTAATSSLELNLYGIVWDKNNPKAIINDSVVGIGDKVGSDTIIEIHENRVILNDGAKNFELRLAQ